MNRKLEPQRFLEEAEASTGLSDWGDLPFMEGLDRLLWSIEFESAVAPDMLPLLLRNMVQLLLVKRLRLVDDRKRFPQIAEQEVRSPIIITGLPRSGSTHLHALMALEPSVRAPLHWEMERPSPPFGATEASPDDRVQAAQADLDRRPNNTALMTSHPFGATRPEQCIGLLDWSFINITVMARARMPTYVEWFLSADYRLMYEHHHRTLQHFQAFHPARRWVLKHPKHLFSLDMLLATYPDAKVVWTHRDPVSVIPSAANFTYTYRRSFTPDPDPIRFGHEWSAMEEMGLRRGMAARDRLLTPERVFDLHFDDLMADPADAVTAIYRRFGHPFSDDLSSRVEAFMKANPREKHGEHRYTPEQYGLSADHLNRRFADYIERFNVRRER